jgi:hypothetical protein
LAAIAADDGEPLRRTTPPRLDAAPPVEEDTRPRPRCRGAGSPHLHGDVPADDENRTFLAQAHHAYDLEQGAAAFRATAEARRDVISLKVAALSSNSRLRLCACVFSVAAVAAFNADTRRSIVVA